MSTNSTNDTNTKKITPKKNLPINKYSIYELKSGIDQSIIQHLEECKWNENQSYSNLKIFIGLIVLFFTGLAYLYPLPFPQNYTVILISVIGYGLFSTVYWYIEKKVICDVFYCGSNIDFCTGLRPGRRFKVKEAKMHSEVKERSSLYQLWFDFVTVEGHKYKSDVKGIECTEVYDERGYIVKKAVVEKFGKIFKEALKCVE